MVVKTTTGGSAWTELYYGGITRGRCVEYGSIIQGGEWNHDSDTNTPDILAISRSTDNGVSWSLYGINDIAGRVHSVAVHPDNPNIIYAAGQTTSDWKGCLFKTEDGGSSWNQLDLATSANIYTICKVIIDPSNSSRVLAATSRGVYISSDGGSHWTPPVKYMNMTCMAIDITNPDLVFAGTWDGFYFSDNGGTSWTEHNAGLYNDVEFRCLEYDHSNHILYAGTAAGGVYTLSITTGIDDTAVLIPESLVLHQNYPNPFNSTTLISCQLQYAAEGKLQIYDIRGRLVRTLIDRKLSAGMHQATWNGRDEKGLAVSSGIYICRLQTETNVLTRKVILQK